MVTHTSGMPDVEDYEWDKPQYDDGALERYVRSLSNQKLIFAPGTNFRYSNMAFEVLGDLIAKVSGESFDDYVRHHILTPLKMRDSTLLKKEIDPKLMTWGHERDKDGQVFPSKVYPYNRMHSPSSNLHSNVEDMARWALANLNHGELDGRRILKEQTYDIMWKPAHKLSDSDGVGISWFLGEYRGLATVSHGGGDPGYATFLVLLPEKKIAVVLMANCDWLSKGRGKIANAALDVALGLNPQPIAVHAQSTMTTPIPTPCILDTVQWGFMPALPMVPTVQLWHSEVPTLAKVILPDAAQRVDREQLGSSARLVA